MTTPPAATAAQPGCYDAAMTIRLRVAFLMMLVGCGGAAARPAPAAPPPAESAMVAAPAPAPPPEAEPPGVADAKLRELDAAERALVGELSALMVEVRAQFEKVVQVLEHAQGDCKAVATALLAPEFTSSTLPARMEAFRAKVAQHGQLGAAAKDLLREVTLAAFPVETRQRAEIIDSYEARCAGDPDFQRALRTTGYRARR
jgi:hypothetical protein